MSLITARKSFFYLSNFRIEKGDKSKSPEGLGNEDIGDLAILRKVLAKVFGSHVLCAPAHKDFAGHLGIGALLAVGDLDIAPAAINHVPLC